MQGFVKEPLTDASFYSHCTKKIKTVMILNSCRVNVILSSNFLMQFDYLFYYYWILHSPPLSNWQVIKPM